VVGRCTNDAETALVAITASMRAMRKRVSHVCRRWPADVKTRANGQPSHVSSRPTSISLLRRACQMRTAPARGLRHSRRRSSKPSRGSASGASRPSQPARTWRASRGAIMRLVAVTPE
jgi:hypothetical protein